MDGQLTRALGGRHARRLDDELPADGLPEREGPFTLTEKFTLVDGDTLMYEHRRRSADMGQAVDGTVPHDPEPRPDLRVRVPRGELQPAEHSRRGAETGSVGARAIVQIWSLRSGNAFTHRLIRNAGPHSIGPERVVLEDLADGRFVFGVDDPETADGLVARAPRAWNPAPAPDRSRCRETRSATSRACPAVHPCRACLRIARDKPLYPPWAARRCR